jgi:hypothetical protein
MKKALLLLVFSTFSITAFAQEKPITQTDYVRMLYTLQKNPSGKAAIIEALRRRGIDFAVTDGLRGLTRSKGGNDEELKQALEEAGRRRENPEAAKLPSAKESAEILEKTRANTLAAINEMPDFVVKQLISRSAAYAGTGNWKPLDNLAIAVSYSEAKGEEYKVLAVNGSPINAEKRGSYAGFNGSSTNGEFVETLRRIFAPESKTEINVLTTDVVRGRRSIVYDYSIDISNNKRMLGYQSLTLSAVPAGEKGRFWVDAGQNRIIKIEYDLTDIPASFPVRAFHQSIDYDWVKITDQMYLLPVLSDARFTSTSQVGLLQDRNYIRFKNYQKYGTEITIVEEEDTPPQEEKP